MPAQPKTGSLSDILHADKRVPKKSHLAKLLSQAANHLSEQEIIDSSLPQEFKGRVLYLARNTNSLSLQCESAAVGARVRMLSESLFKSCAKPFELEQPFRIIIKVRPAHFKHKRSKTKPKQKLSEDCKQSIREAAHTLSDDKMAQALLRITETE